MPTAAEKMAAMAELYKRGKLPPDRVAAFEELFSRGRITEEGEIIPRGPTAGQVLTEEAQKIPGAPIGGKEFVRELAPIAGDIAASMLPGGRAVKGAKLGTKALNLLFRAGKSAAGSGLGETAGQVVTGEGLDVGDITEQMAYGAGGEFAMAPIGAAGKPVLNLAAKGLRSMTITGHMTAQALRSRLMNRTFLRGQNFVQSLAPDIPMAKVPLGLEMGGFFKNLSDFNRAYKPFNDAVERAADRYGPNLTMVGTHSFLKDLVQTRFGGDVSKMVTWLGFKGSDRKIAAAEAVTDILREGYTNAYDLRLILSNIWGKFEQGTKAANDAKLKLKELLVDDIDMWAPEVNLGSFMAGQVWHIPGAKEARQTADKIYGEVQEFLKKTPAVKNIIQDLRQYVGKYYEQFPGEAVDRMFQRGQVAELTRIRDVLRETSEGAKMWENLRYHWIRDYYESAISRSEVSAKAQFRPLLFVDNVMRDSRNIEAVLGPEIFQKFMQEVKHYDAVAKEFEAYETGMSAFGMGRATVGPAVASGMAAAGVGTWMAIPAIEGFGAMSAWALLSDSGKRILTEFARSIGKVAVRGPRLRKKKEKKPPNAAETIDLMNIPKQ